jgi:hypothetical protein
MADETTKRRKWTPTAREELLAALMAYVDDTEIPILAEFAVQNHVRRQALYEFTDLADAIKECIDKKEAGLERLMLTGKATTGCIFSLKQLGWKDTQSIEHSGSIDFYANLTPEERMARIAELGKKLAANG